MQANTSVNRGFTIIEAIVILVALAIIGGLGYMAYTHFIAKPQTNANTTSNMSASTSTPAPSPSNASESPIQIKSDSDLNTISNQLDGLNLDDDESSQYTNDSNSF